jgi:hypothetical protein
MKKGLATLRFCIRTQGSLFASRSTRHDLQAPFGPPFDYQATPNTSFLPDPAALNFPFRYICGPSLSHRITLLDLVTVLVLSYQGEAAISTQRRLFEARLRGKSRANDLRQVCKGSTFCPLPSAYHRPIIAPSFARYLSLHFPPLTTSL